MQITVNGQGVTLEKEVTISELLVVHKVEMPDYVTVQVNSELIAKEEFATIVIKDGDAVEFLYFMGGGTV